MNGLANYSDTAPNRQKTVVILTAYGIWPMLEFELDIIQRELDIGNRVILLQCFGRQTYCPANNPKPGQKFKKRICQECVSRVKSGIEWLNYESGKLIVAEYESATKNEINSIQDILSELDNLKKEKNLIRPVVNIEEIDIYESAYSQLITNLSDSRPDLERNWDLFRSLIEIGLVSYYSAKKVFQAYNPDMVYVFNGRISRYRPFLRLAQRNGCEVRVHEYPVFGFENYSVTYSTYPHDINQVSQQLRREFETIDASFSIIQKKAREWFEDRSNYRFDALNDFFFQDTFNHIKNINGLPKYWDNNEFNIVFFVSSEFERADIEENDRITPFGQAEAVRLINKLFPEIICTVRIHPNLQKRDRKFVEELEALQHLNNVEIIAASDNYNSYELMLNANLVLTFGSTMGVESAFRKKPVLNIGPALYSAFNCVACCQDTDEFKSLITAAVNNDLSSFPSIEQRYTGACQFAYANLKSGVSPKYLKKNSYYGGKLIRQGKRKEIRASYLIIFKNRLMDFISRVCVLLIMFLYNPRMAINIIQTKLQNIYSL